MCPPPMAAANLYVIRRARARSLPGVAPRAPLVLYRVPRKRVRKYVMRASSFLPFFALCQFFQRVPGGARVARALAAHIKRARINAMLSRGWRRFRVIYPIIVPIERAPQCGCRKADSLCARAREGPICAARQGLHSSCASRGATRVTRIGESETDPRPRASAFILRGAGPLCCALSPRVRERKREIERFFRNEMWSELRYCEFHGRGFL